MDEEILRSLLKRAKGYNYNEVQEEFAVGEDGKLELVKRKVLEKYCPPDSAALKTYLELNPDPSLAEMSDEALEQEKQRLLGELRSLDEASRSGKKEGAQKHAASKDGGQKYSPSRCETQKRAPSKEDAPRQKSGANKDRSGHNEMPERPVARKKGDKNDKKR